MGGIKGQARSPMKRWTKVVFIWIPGGVALFVLCVLVFGLGPYDIPAQSRRLDEVIAESKRLGLPMTQADLKPAVPIPDDQNAAVVVLRLVRDLREPAYWCKLKEELTEEERQQAYEEFLVELAAHESVLDEIVLAIETRPKWFIDRDYDLGVHLLFPEYARLKNLAKWLGLRAENRAEKGDLAKAMRDLRATRTLAQHLTTEPTLIGQYVASSVDGIAIESLEAVMDRFSRDRGALQMIEGEVAAIHVRLNPQIALRGEFYSSLTFTRNLKFFGGIKSFYVVSTFDDDWPPPLNPRTMPREGLPMGGFERAYMTAVAEVYNESFRLFEANESVRGWSDVYVKAEEQARDSSRFSDALLRIVFPHMDEVEAVVYVVEAQQQIMIALCRVMRFRAENGWMPSSLAEAGADLPDATQEGSFLLAEIDEERLRIWSRGRNGVDDSGTSFAIGMDTSVFWPHAYRQEFRDAMYMLPAP